MKTVKQKLEEQYKKIVDKFPELVLNQMHLGSGNHPNFKIWEETSLKVSRDTLEKYKTLRHILNVWNADKVSDVKNKRLDYIFKENKMYNLAKLLIEEITN